ncbi:MAG: bifunctional diaminohydroxyphosphoribosylaminopyrimidine deaminase/5-amino-6-(5-phosphoribosylamino)uracil reductase RibD [Planctomycetota bacterium]|nr:bifunctional diaminohydroxyphosphoribosylaminopyrimidine deaminase/5-amino-6-(5-phosphoribosylamino)uracil reductase RibD [Planctomycetota bacterium]MDA1164375.1 bifunctional diaminohydroxyphosphoribosylaminopyrimidine deaminase/5-amino-6-(5-phosphoribosylamino)uracil reductase RibD [Planctomycetota bacterium]
MSAPAKFDSPNAVMSYAIELASRGLGRVEPNPAVGAVIVDDHLNLLAHGYHEKFGGAHAEANAIANLVDQVADANSRRDLVARATLYVTLEPCCHHGKTPPCADALIDAGIRRVVVGIRDPSPHVDGGGIQRLNDAGIDVTLGVREEHVRRLNAPFLKLMLKGLPWVHCKWAMTLDGKIATRTGVSKWISGEPSRQRVHMLRGRMDAIIVGAGTARADDPFLTVRIPGPRTPVRVILDSLASLPLDSQLVRTAAAAPVLVAVSESAPSNQIEQLRSAGVEVFVVGPSSTVNLRQLLTELGRRSMTNVLIEGGGQLLGSAFDDNLVDEAHVFVAPKFAGGADAVTPVAGIGREFIPEVSQLRSQTVEQVGDDVYIHGRLR